jgi:hypothetical protein
MECAAAVAKHDSSTARRYLQAAIDSRAGQVLSDAVGARAYLIAVQLAIAAYGGLVGAGLDGDWAQLDRLAATVNRVAAPAARARLWADLALRFYANEMLDDCRRTVQEELRPLLEAVKRKSESEYHSVLEDVFAALYVSHAPTAMDALGELSGLLKDGAILKAGSFLLRKVPLSEPFEHTPGHSFDVSYEEISDICSLAKHCESDNVVYVLIESIADSVAGKYRDNYSRDQQEAIAKKLEELLKLLPKPQYIQHDGYIVAGRA